MTFKTKLTTKQYKSIWGVIIGLGFLYLISNDTDFLKKIVFLFALVLIAISLMNFFSEVSRKHKIITNPHKNFDSKGEEIIAEYFERKNIRYNLHPVIKLPKQFWVFNIPFAHFKLHPDFFLPEFNVFVEYWGMIDNPEYKKNSNLKKKLYKDNGLEYISLYPKALKNLDWEFTQKLLEVLKEREGIARHWK